MENNEYRKKLKSQIEEAFGRVVYTYTAHYKIVDRLRNWVKWVRIIQIVLTSISTVGFLATVITNEMVLSWLGGITAALSLGLNLYMKEFDNQKEIIQHENAANDLWDVRESYVSLIIDFEVMQDEEIKSCRDDLQRKVSEINRKYQGTDSWSYRKAQKALKTEEEQTFKEGEVEELLPSILRNK